MASRSNVVDFVRFREARERARLPLFETPSEVATLTPATRPLSNREVEHRERMLAHLGRPPLALAEPQ